MKPERPMKAVSKKRTAASSGFKKKTTAKRAINNTEKKSAAKNNLRKRIATKEPTIKKSPVVAVAVAAKLAHRPRYDLALAFILSLGAILLVGYTAKMVWAAEFAEPPGGPSEGNIPVTVWNRDVTVIGGEGGIWPEKQQDTSINIDGQAYFGDGGLNLTGTGDAQHLLYGVAHYYDGSSATYYMDRDDYLMKLETTYTNYPSAGTDNTYTRFYVSRGGTIYAAGGSVVNAYQTVGSTNRQMVQNGSSSYIYYGSARFDETSPSGVYYADPDLDYFLWMRSYDYTGNPDAGYSSRFTVDVTGDVWADGRIKSEGCFGSTFVGFTATGGPSGNGVYRPQDVNGYYDANNNCAADHSGSHVCTSAEILESIKCSEEGHPIRTVLDGTRGWVNAGPPGHISNYNDCEGWSSSSASSYARYWIFDLITGGRGTGVSCNTFNGIQFACCK